MELALRFMHGKLRWIVTTYYRFRFHVFTYW